MSPVQDQTALMRICSLNTGFGGLLQQLAHDIETHR
jgi:hypothetical protein